MEDLQVKWQEARKRMAEGVEAVLCFDFGLTGQELFDCTSSVLDDVVMPEFEKAVAHGGDLEDFRDQWKSARTRIAEGVEPILCSNLGATVEEIFGYMSFMLDDVFLCEFEKLAGCELPKSWCVLARGATGGIIVGSGLTESEAVTLTKRLGAEKGYGKHVILREF